MTYSALYCMSDNPCHARAWHGMARHGQGMVKAWHSKVPDLNEPRHHNPTTTRGAARSGHQRSALRVLSWPLPTASPAQITGHRKLGHLPASLAKCPSSRTLLTARTIIIKQSTTVHATAFLETRRLHNKPRCRFLALAWPWSWSWCCPRSWTRIKPTRCQCQLNLRCRQHRHAEKTHSRHSSQPGQVMPCSEVWPVGPVPRGTREMKGLSLKLDLDLDLDRNLSLSCLGQPSSVYLPTTGAHRPCFVFVCGILGGRLGGVGRGA